MASLMGSCVLDSHPNPDLRGVSPKGDKTGHHAGAAAYTTEHVHTASTLLLPGPASSQCLPAVSSQCLPAASSQQLPEAV